MTDEQWLWLYGNMALDNDELLEGMCPKCRDEVSTHDKCTRCGTTLSLVESFRNPNFDKERFNELASDNTNPNFNTEAYNRLNGGD